MTYSNNNINEHVTIVALMNIERYNSNIDAHCNNNTDEHDVLQ
jgi:hypothetical protein